MSLNSAHEGYDYQDLLTSYFILKEILLGHQESSFSVDKKHTSIGVPDRFDDLVIINDLGIQRKQIKYSNASTSKKLLKEDLANDSGYTLAIYELYNTWEDLNVPNSEFRLCLAWDESTDINIASILDPVVDVEMSFNNFTSKLFKININTLWPLGSEPLSTWRSFRNYVRDNAINRSDFEFFCNSLIIELELPKAGLGFSSPSDLENILIEQARKLGIEQYPNDDIYINDFLERLAKKVGEYRTRSAEKNCVEILSDLNLKTNFGHIEQRFEVDQTKNIKSDDKFSQFKTVVIDNKKTLLLGEPGSGKSWFLTNFIDYLNKTNQKLIRHYCYTSTEDEYVEKRVSSDIFFGNLINDILNHFPSLQKEKEKLFVSDLNELNLLLSHISEEVIIIIDGLDHINRVLKLSSVLSEEKTKIIDFISQIDIPENISIVLGSQPIDEIQELLKNFDYKESIIQKWDEDNVIELMEKFEFNDLLIDGVNLSRIIFEKSSGNPLYLTYIIKTLKSEEELSKEVIEKFPEYDFNLEKYYEYLTSQITDNITSEVLSCLEFSVIKPELMEIIPFSGHLENNLRILSPVINENLSRGGISLYHDSFRRFNIEKLIESSNINDIYKCIIKWLEKKDFYKNEKSYRYLLSYYIKSTKFKKVKRYATNDFLTKSLYYGHSESIIEKNYNNFLFVAKETQDWELFIFISELNRTIYTTISEDYHSQFSENFELYFEAIGLIYGFKRVNEILFFEGKKNFNDELVIKALSISQKYGVNENWELMEDYFSEKEKKLKTFNYYISYLIGINEIENFYTRDKNKLIDITNGKFFKAFIITLYKGKGFTEILKFYNLIDDFFQVEISNRINTILNDIHITEKISTEVVKRHTVLEELKLDFLGDDYVKKESLDELYFLVREYSIYNIKTLEKLGEEIPSLNFFYNWIKYFIKIFVIENNTYDTHKDLENDLIQNFEFLSSDVERFKGKPRTVDFTHENRELIQFTINHALKYIKSKKAWKKTILLLDKIPFETASILDKYVNQKNIDLLISNYESLDKSENENYDTHLGYALKKSILYMNADKKKKAKAELYNAVHLMTAYTFHKDVTLSEVIEPLTVINKIEDEFSLKYAKKLKYLTDAVMKHTDDGKGTKWLTTEWFEKLLKIDYKLASLYLINMLLKKEYFWKYEDMYVSFINESNTLNPIILNFLCRLSPTNTSDDYLDSFLDNIYNVVPIDSKLACTSMVNILSRNLNNHREQLSDKTFKKLIILKNHFNLRTKISLHKENQPNDILYKKVDFKVQIEENIIKGEPLKEKTLEELIEYFDMKINLTDMELNFVTLYISEVNDYEISKKLLLSLFKKRVSSGEDYYNKLQIIVNGMNYSEDEKIFLLINIFIYSSDGWFATFSNKEALKTAIFIDKEKALSCLAQCLQVIFTNISFGSKTTANLIIAFEYVGVDSEKILSMYKRGFEFIEYRLPDNNDFKWKQVQDKNTKKLNSDEIAIVMILSKLKNLDTIVQKEILVSIDYLINYNENLLIEPMKWFFKNANLFPHVSIAGIIEILLLYVNKTKIDFFNTIKKDVIKVKKLNNLYLQNSIETLIERIDNVD